jgi:S1-C subfamily serine protease
MEVSSFIRMLPVGFAVPVNTVRRVAPQLITRGRYPHPWLGVQLLPLTPKRAQTFRQAEVEMAVEEGLLVIEVVRGSPADKGGIQGGDEIVQLGNARIPLGGDIITAINGEPMTDSQELTVYLETQTQVGDVVEVTIVRDGEEQNVQVTLAERPR